MFCKYVLQSAAGLFIFIAVPFAKQMVFILMTSNLAVCSLLAAWSFLWGSECSSHHPPRPFLVVPDLCSMCPPKAPPTPLSAPSGGTRACPASAASQAQETIVGPQLGASTVLKLPSFLSPPPLQHWEVGPCLQNRASCFSEKEAAPSFPISEPFYFFPQPCHYIRSSREGALSPPPWGHRQCDKISLSNGTRSME